MSSPVVPNGEVGQTKEVVHGGRETLQHSACVKWRVGNLSGYRAQSQLGGVGGRDRKDGPER